MYVHAGQEGGGEAEGEGESSSPKFDTNRRPGSMQTLMPGPTVAVKQLCCHFSIHKCEKVNCSCLRVSSTLS